MSFHVIQFPKKISFGSRGGPMRKTTIVTSASGGEERNSLWANSLRIYDIGYGIKTLNDIHDIIDFFEERRGQFYGFRYFDKLDYKSSAPLSNPSFDDQILGQADGVQVEFQLQRLYGDLHARWERKIIKPILGSVTVGIDGVEIASSEWQVNSITGIVTFNNAPANLSTITAGFEFDVPVRFDTDQIEISIEAFEAGDIQSIKLKEIR